jgi:hypothetical protein
VKTLLQEATRESIVRRAGALRADSPRRWGRMTAPQMVCHLNDSFRASLGEKYASPSTNLFRRTLMKNFALWVPLPWPHGIKTRPEMDAQIGGTKPAGFDEDIQQFRTLLDRFCAAQTLEPHSMFGPMSRSERMRWAYLHIDHHFRQFGI